MIDLSKLEFNVTLKKSRDQVWQAWTDSKLITNWFSPEANIEPRVGGAYELFFDPSKHEHESTIGCKIIEIKPHEYLSFQWKGPGQFIDIMNQPDPLTHVHVEFKKNGSSTDVRVVHDGWKPGAEWDEAKAWHKKAWEQVLSDLEKYINQ